MASSTMDFSELLEIVERGEGSQHQFKENVTNAQSLAAEMAALSNSEGGMILLGVSENGSVAGLTKEDIHRINQLISNAASQLVKNPINPRTEIIKVDAQLVLVVKVLEEVDKPYIDNSGAIWIRSGADKRKVTSKEELRRLFQSSDLIYSDEIPVPGTNVDNVDLNHFEAFYSKEFDENLDELEIPPIRVLQNLNLAKGESLNLAGLLLFGKNPQRLKPPFLIKAVSFFGTEPTGGSYRDSEDIGGNFEPPI